MINGQFNQTSRVLLPNSAVMPILKTNSYILPSVSDTRVAIRRYNFLSSTEYRLIIVTCGNFVNKEGTIQIFELEIFILLFLVSQEQCTRHV